MTYELPLRDTVPLSVTAHRLIHLPLFWKTALRPWVNWGLRLLMVCWVIVFWLLPGR